MGSLSGGAVEHLVPVLEIVALAVAALVTLLVAFWRGFKWLDTQMTARFAELIREFTAANDRRHEGHDRAISDLRERDNERAEAIKRVHARVDSVWERIGVKP